MDKPIMPTWYDYKMHHDGRVRQHYAHAVEELYDCVAVLLRTIDVLEGRQKLGKPEAKGAK